jgi:peptidyl-prolyl cis-trans isomerase D
MISWLQRNFQQHYKILFGGLLIVVIISFVFVTNASSGLGRAERQALAREFFGYNLGSEEGQARVYGDANLSATLQLGYAGFGSEQLQQYALQRVAALHLADQLHLPATSKAEIADHIKTLGAFTGNDGQFDPVRYAAFRDNLKTGRITEPDITRVIAGDVRAGKAQMLAAGPGYVLDEDVKTQLARAETRWSLGLATVNYAAYAPAISPDSTQLAKYFEDNSFRYEISPRVTVGVVNFTRNAYLDSVTVTEDEVRARFDASPTNFFKPANNPTDPKALQVAEAGDFLLVRSDVEATLKSERAQRMAIKAASDLSYALFEKRIGHDPAAIGAFLAARNLTLQPLAPFAADSGPAGFGHAPEIASAAFKLNAERHFSDAIPYDQGAVVLFWQDTEPARKPLLAEVAAKVTADYVESEKRKRFVELGRALKSAIESRLKAGDSFAQAAAAAGRTHAIEVETKLTPAFTAREPAADMDYPVLGALERLEKDQVSDMIITAEKGIIVFAADRQLPDLTPANPQYAMVRAQLASLTARLGANTHINELVAGELKRTEPKVN